MAEASSAIRTALTAIWAALHTTQYGLAITTLNGIQDAVTCNLEHEKYKEHGYFKPCVNMTDAQFGVVVSIFTLGGLIGSFSSDLLTRKFGRINTFRISALCTLLGSMCVGLANSVSVMMLGRISIGLGCGLATVSVPLFLSEIAPPSIKKSLGIMNQLFIVIGMFIGQSLSFPFAEYSKWRYVFALSVALAMLQIVSSGLIRVPQLRRDIKRTASEEDALLASEDSEERQEERNLSIKDLFTSKDKAIRKGLNVVIIVLLAQQFCGISPVMYFSTRILKPVFSGNSRSIALGIVGFKLPLTVLPAFIIERTGTRPILLFSSAIMIFASLLLAYGLNADSGPAAATAILSFVGSYSVGLGPVAWVVLSEVMPPQATTAAGALGIGMSWILNFVMGATFLPVQKWLSGGKESGEGNIFYLIAGHCIVAFLFIKASYAAYDAAKRRK